MHKQLKKPSPSAMQNSRPSSLMLLLPVLLLAACGTSSPRPEGALPRIPQPPSLTTPIPQQTYSRSAQEDIQRWQKRLTGTLPIQQP